MWKLNSLYSWYKKSFENITENYSFQCSLCWVKKQKDINWSVIVYSTSKSNIGGLKRTSFLACIYLHLSVANFSIFTGNLCMVQKCHIRVWYRNLPNKFSWCSHPNFFFRIRTFYLSVNINTQCFLITFLHLSLTITLMSSI